MSSVLKKTALATIGLTGLIVGCTGQGLQSEKTVAQVLNLTGSFASAKATSLREKLMKIILPDAVAFSPVIKDNAGNDVSLDIAWISLQEIKLKAADDDETDDSAETEDTEDVDDSVGGDVVIEGPHFIDLMSNEPFRIDLQALLVQEYSGIILKLHKESSQPENAPEALAENSIYLSGSVGGTRFTYAADDSTEIQLLGTQSLVPDTESNLLVVFGFADMISKIDLSVITMDTDISNDNKVDAVNPCPLIDPSANDLYTCFRKGLEEQAKFGKDDGDHDLDEADEVINDEE